MGSLRKRKGPKRKAIKKSILIRAPRSLHDDLQYIKEKSGISINAICLDILRNGVKKKIALF